MSYSDVPIWEKYTLTIEGGSQVFPYWGKEVAKTGGRKLRRQLADNEWQPRPD